MIILCYITKMDSVFGLSKSPPNFNHVAKNQHNERIPPNRTVADSAFPNGVIEIPFGQSRPFIPSKCNIAHALDLTKANGNSLEVADGIAYANDPVACLYTKMEVTLNGSVVSSNDVYHPQIEACNMRSSRSGAWLDSVGESLHEMKPDLDARIADVSSDGVDNNNSSVKTYAELGMAGTVTLAYVYTTGVVTLSGTGDVNGEIQVGDIISFIGHGGYRISSPVLIRTSNTSFTIYPSLDDGTLTATAMTTCLLRRTRNDAALRAGKRVFPYQPSSLAFFKHDGVMPPGNWSLRLYPAAASVYKKHAVESYTAKTPGTDYELAVKSIFFMQHSVDVPDIEDGTYYNVLEEISAYTDTLPAGTSLNTTKFNVPPSTYGLTVAFQGQDAGSATNSSLTRFRVGATDNDQYLSQFWIDYASQSVPPYHAQPERGSNSQKAQEMYVDSMTNNGLLNRVGGCEDLVEYQKRGSYYRYNFLKAKGDQSTVANVYSQFSSAVSNLRMLLFAHHRNTVVLQVKHGRVESANVVPLLD